MKIVAQKSGARGLSDWTVHKDRDKTNRNTRCKAPATADDFQEGGRIPS